MAHLKLPIFLLAIFCSNLFSIAPLNAATVNLVQNGSFELGSYTPSSPYDYNTLGQGSTAITDWRVVSNPAYGNIDWVGTYWNANDGNKSIDLNGNTTGLGGGIQQVINTTQGQLYKLTFDMAANPDGGPSIRPM